MICFVINPASKTGLGVQIWQKLKVILDNRKIDYRFYMTDPVRNAAVITGLVLKKYTENNLKLIILGGDGTINEALQALKKEDFDRVLLGYIPTGSSNDLARALNYKNTYPSPEEILLHFIESGEFRLMDLGYLSYNKPLIPNTPDRYFIVSSGIGFDASVCKEAMDSKGKSLLNQLHIGKLSYGAISVKQILSTEKIGCTITIDDGDPFRLERCYFVSVMNHCYQGGGIKFCPDATDDDGLLDVCYVSDISRARVLMTLPSAFKGKHVNKKGIGITNAHKIHIVYDIPMWVHTDGEVMTEAHDITVTVMPSCLRFLI